jgi:hypothetical protein
MSEILQNSAKYAGMGSSFGPWGALAGATVGAGIGYLQHRKGIKDAKRIDEMGLESYSDSTLPEYRDVENKYRDIANYGIGSGEANTFMNKSNSAMYAQQLNAQSMAGGSLAKYTLAMNNANVINAQANLASQNFQRQMQGLQGFTSMLNMRQGRADRDTSMENESRLRAGQAAANLSSQGLSNIAGAVSMGSQLLAYSGGFGGGGTDSTGGGAPSTSFPAVNDNFKFDTSSPFAQRGAFGKYMMGPKTQDIPFDDSSLEIGPTLGRNRN